jgi:hypothetical protein
MGARAIIIVMQSDLKLFRNERQRACRVQALLAIVRRQPPTEIRRPVQVHQLIDHCLVDDDVTSGAIKTCSFKIRSGHTIFCRTREYC